MPERLDKLVAKGTGLSRKDARQAIRNGRVLLEGKQIAQPDAKIPEDAVPLFDGRPLTMGWRYLMLNKPIGVVCATKDKDAPTVLDLLPANLRKDLFPAGRLDKDTEGFVLLTDDGAFAHRLLAPKNKVGKTYLARLDAIPDMAMLADAFSRSLDLGGAEVTSPARLRLVEEAPNPLVELTIYEGMYHQVKRMFAKFSYRVTHLERIAIGSVNLDPVLPRGEHRPLTGEEISALMSAVLLRPGE